MTFCSSMRAAVAVHSNWGGMLADRADAGRCLAERLRGFPASTSWCWVRHDDRDNGDRRRIVPIKDEERSEALESETADLGSSLDEKDQTIVAEDAEDSPRDTPLAATDYGITGAAERRDEPLTERLRREIPEVSAGYRPVDPDRLAARAFPGRLVADDDQAQLAEGNSGGFSAEEAAMHLVPPPRRPRSGRGSTAERLELLETQVDVLLRTVRVLVEALGALAEAEETLPTEEAGEHDAKVNRAAHTAHELLLTLREYS